MRKLVLVLISALTLTMFLGSCKKTCNDVNAPNYSQEGTCLDYASAIAGTYNGSIEDTIAGTPANTRTISVSVTKIDASHVQITPSDGSIAFTAKVTALNGNYLLAVTAGTYQQEPYTGYSLVQFGVNTNGFYNTSTRQFGYELDANDGTNDFQEAFFGSR